MIRKVRQTLELAFLLSLSSISCGTLTGNPPVTNDDQRNEQVQMVTALYRDAVNITTIGDSLLRQDTMRIAAEAAQGCDGPLELLNLQASSTHTVSEQTSEGSAQVELRIDRNSTYSNQTGTSFLQPNCEANSPFFSDERLSLTASIMEQIVVQATPLAEVQTEDLVQTTLAKFDTVLNKDGSDIIDWEIKPFEAESQVDGKTIRTRYQASSGRLSYANERASLTIDKLALDATDSAGNVMTVTFDSVRADQNSCLIVSGSVNGELRTADGLLSNFSIGNDGYIRFDDGNDRIFIPIACVLNER